MEAGPVTAAMGPGKKYGVGPNRGLRALIGPPRALQGAQISRPRGVLKGKDGATDDSRRAHMGPVGVLSVTAGLLGI